MERTPHNRMADSPRYTDWSRKPIRPITPLSWSQDEFGQRHNVEDYTRASTEVRMAAIDHKVNEIGVMVAQIFGSLGMTGQLPEQIKAAQVPQERSPVGFGS